ncbi:MAG TPA: hypothetical protein VLD62_11725 [Acidimicrobiia bacterium]|nr:hypothetical protein [Acidimicrobiia bacterium]
MADTPNDLRPIGVSLSKDQLRIGDVCNVTIEPRMLGERTGTFVTFKNVVYQGDENGVLRFDSELEAHRFPGWEIERVVLVDPPETD